MNVDHHLSRDECLKLLRDQWIGRLAVVVNGRAEIFPINYVLDGDAVVFRTNSGTKLAGTTQGEVAFEVDMTHTPSQTGWSVVVHGVAQEVTAVDRADLQERLRSLPLGVWAAGERPHQMRIAPHEITGRRVGPSEPDAARARPPAVAGSQAG
jgi:nitroimidazol reductase NimA-like FMN-containing flavoprotein (pyridoxamine 5'-phosphate oxidase superfamily)